MLKYKSTKEPIVIGHSPDYYTSPPVRTHLKAIENIQAVGGASSLVVILQSCSLVGLRWSQRLKYIQFKRRRFVNKALSGSCIACICYSVSSQSN